MEMEFRAQLLIKSLPIWIKLYFVSLLDDFYPKKLIDSEK